MALSWWNLTSLRGPVGFLWAGLTPKQELEIVAPTCGLFMWFGYLTARQLQNSHTSYTVAQSSKLKCPLRKTKAALSL